MKRTFIAEIEGTKLSRKSSREYVAAVLAKSKTGWGIFSSHETWDAAAKSEKLAISWMENGVYESVALVGMYSL